MPAPSVRLLTADVSNLVDASHVALPYRAADPAAETEARGLEIKHTMSHDHPQPTHRRDVSKACGKPGAGLEVGAELD